MEEKRYTVSEIEQKVTKYNREHRGHCLCGRKETCSVCDGSRDRELDRLLKILKEEVL